MGMIQPGTRPVAPNPQQKSFSRTFGTVSAPSLPEEFDADAHLEIPDQLADGLPYGCTDYTVRELATSEDGRLYEVGFNYDKSREYEGKSGQDVGVDIKDAFKCATVYGLKVRGTSADLNDDPLLNRRAPYYEVHPDNGLDYFDSIRSALLRAFQRNGKKHAAGNGTPWLPEWALPQQGIIPDIFTYDGKPAHYSWHAWAFVGWVTKDGIPYLKAKTWQGENYGDVGYSYYPREVVNKVFDQWGTIVLMQVKALKGQDDKVVKLTLIEFALHYIMKILSLGGYKEALPLLIRILGYLRL